MLATVLGQDLEQDGGVFQIARKVAAGRVISTVDPEARHGHKTVRRSFDGYKGHLAEDPDSEIITATAVTPGNTGDAEPAAELLADLLQPAPDEPTDQARAEVYGDGAYGTGPLPAELDSAGVEVMVKVQAANAPGGRFSKDAFTIDLEAGQVTCPNQITAPIRPKPGGGGTASFGTACATCPLTALCTTAKNGRVITIGPYEEHLARGRAPGPGPPPPAPPRSPPALRRRPRSRCHAPSGATAGIAALAPIPVPADSRLDWAGTFVRS